MTDSLEYNDINAEVRGVLSSGRLKLTDQNIIFKNNKTGKVEQISVDDIDLINSQKFVGTWGLRVFTKSGALHRFTGFRDSEHEKLGKFIKDAYSQEMVEKEMCVKGWNWGTARFMGSVLSFDKDSKTIFEVPLSHVSQCVTGKNEVTLEYHQNDDAPVGLLEMRFHIPAVESADDDPVEKFHQNVMSKASVISASGESIAIFREIQILTPRGRYDIKIFSTFFQLHGKTFDYKIPMDSVLRLFMLPHKDSRQMFFVLSLDPPIKQGQTRYHYLVLLFAPDEETTIELPFSEAELRDKYEGKLEKELSGPVYEVMGKVMKVLIGRKITGPGNFIGHSGTAAVGCSFKAAAGYLYPLERGFIYIHKPPLHIRFEEISSVNFARSGGSTRSFDFEVTLKNGTVHIFSSIEKEEYAKLFDFITQKKLHVSNMGKDKSGYKDVDFGDSDNENEPDAYLARLKAEAREKEEEDDDGDDSDEESTDEDFKPNENESDVAEEYDSNVEDDSDDDSDASGGGGDGGTDGSTKKKHKEKKNEKKEKTHKEKEKIKKPTKKKDTGKPKRGTSAFMLWLNDTRESIKRENPGIKVTEIAKKGGEMWKELKDKSKWEEAANKDKIRYQEEMRNYKSGAGGGSEDEKGGTSKATKKRKSEPSPSKKANTSGSGFKSKEYISDDESTSDDQEKVKEIPKKKNKSTAEDKDKNSKKSESEGGDSDDASNASEDDDEEEDEGSD
ncbi:GL11071 [Drosophila persimilis]|uniref:FACT complex subunit Ssrp1 n=3 Tax=pseudoobscura subgroup TaxID=32358 RepID=SSRP1_DROPS|nr:FACT complex subunit Ssrp1 [Drosophila pseudoobscura]XP_002015416.1 FACT complex subunit Ssrp1 [Drosophila persimilis]Q293F6.2 RecName: Full=FACT complex subunit Ssrp1; AltName: Full=Facilitates chromatin transcription complex subunit Ssrp1; AltName: Full=Recombination signal sequence recognition protein; AltName: Full=Single-strand recognition protein [Drosophila pseudoobscura pseudoobscura]EDW31306.1 GL11071 [Drosophila persimilis]